MIEDLYHLLAVHGLLDLGIDLSNGSLLLRKIRAGALRERRCRKEREDGHSDRDEREPPVQRKHGDQHHGHHKCGVDDLRDGLAYHLAQGVDVVRIDRHYVAMLFGIEVRDRELLHLGKQAAPEIL